MRLYIVAGYTYGVEVKENQEPVVYTSKGDAQDYLKRVWKRTPKSDLSDYMESGLVSDNLLIIYYDDDTVSEFEIFEVEI